MHPLEIFDQWRRRWLGWLPLAAPCWDRPAQEVSPEKQEDWLLEPLSYQEASALFPHLSKESAIVQYQKFRLQLRKQSERGF